MHDMPLKINLPPQFVIIIRRSDDRALRHRCHVIMGNLRHGILTRRANQYLSRQSVRVKAPVTSTIRLRFDGRSTSNQSLIYFQTFTLR